MKISRALLATLVVAFTLAACKVGEPAGTQLKSGFSGNDCASAKADLDVQIAKLSEARREFVEQFEAFQRGGGSPGSTAATTATVSTSTTTTIMTTGNSTAQADGSSNGIAGPTATDQSLSSELGDLSAFNLDNEHDASGAGNGEHDVSAAGDSGSRAASDPRATLADDIRQASDCENKLLRDGGTGSASSVYEDLFQRCSDYFRILTLVQAREGKLDSPECKQGADIGKVAPVFVSSCDTPCQFTNVECGLVELDAAGTKRRFACGSTRAALDAAQGYCREFNIPDASCQIGTPRLIAGNQIAATDATIAGQSGESLQLALSSIGAASTGVAYSGGVVAELGARIEFKAEGAIQLVLVNDQRAVRAGEFLAAGTETSCKMAITGFNTDSVRAFAGVGGSFKVLGNGVDVKAGVEGSFALTLQRSVEAALGAVDGGGLEASVVIERCIPLAKQWLESNLDKEFKPFAEQLSAHVDEFKETSARASEAAFGALTRAEETLHTQDRIFCETNAASTLGGGHKVYRINTVKVSVANAAIALRVNYSGSINPMSYDMSHVKAVKGERRGEELLQLIVDHGATSMSDDDVRWLLTDAEYSGGDRFTDCYKTSF